MQIDSRDPEVHLYRGLLCYRQRNWNDAKNNLQDAIAFAQDRQLKEVECKALGQLARVHVDEGYPGRGRITIKDAVDKADNLKNTEPQLFAELCLLRAKIAHLNGDPNVFENSLRDAKIYAKQAKHKNLVDEIAGFEKSLIPINPPNSVPPIVLSAQN